MQLRALQGFLNSVFKLANITLFFPHYTSISRRAKDVEVSFKTKTRGVIQHLAIDATGLKVYGEWKVKKNGTDGNSRVWPKLHIAVGTNTHEIVVAKLNLSNVTDAEELPNLLKQTRRKIIEISGDGAMTQGIAMMLYGYNKKLKKRYGYHKRSLSETAMYRLKLLLGGEIKPEKL